MMRVLDDGVEITLAGKSSDSLFVWSIAMLGCALVVAVICFTLPVPYAIGAVAVWAVLMYFFNQKKHAAKTHKHHAQGTLIIKNRLLIINGVQISLSQDAKISSDGERLSVFDKGLCHHFAGFTDVREIEIAKAVLEGQKIAKRAKEIKMGG
ncbi:hypothetical protein LU290_02475 [Moraxella nasibovis]|uniref:hypothetical protein n=1 Tax=Moraxella nasibovis TaxID=2904120 RepID=UPI00240FD07F|nr:hypothetical protein [Moraxella nasibovis]WFF39113.1 hypothetical protein LU290_02475 [Moraxella nasibovis]